jgi:UDP-N-acetylglucosamine transferase subunit ALG13
MRKPLIVVVNTTLQGNHQTELADAMADDGHCLSTTPEDLVKIVNQVADGSIPIEKFTKMFPEPDLGLFPKMLSEMFGFDD